MPSTPPKASKPRGAFRRPPPGSRPGTLVLPSGSPPPKITVVAFGPDHYERRELTDISELAALRASAGEVTLWVDVQGLGDEQALRTIADSLDIHPLALEDAVNIPQRPKRETYASHELIVARVPLLDGDDLRLPQVALFVGGGFVVTFQERRLGFFDQVRGRITEGLGPIRSAGSGYLAYALVDALVDHFYPVVESIAQQADELEDEVFTRSKGNLMQRLHVLRRLLTNLRRVALPQREVLRDLVHHPGLAIGAEHTGYWRDTYDHAAQLLDSIDATRDVARSLVESYLSKLSHRQNEIMKVLTLTGSIFIPLTFVAGIYGMNFENMPELKSDRGYHVVLGVMLVVASGMLIYFRKRGWLSSD